MLTRTLAVATVLLAALVIHQYSRMGQVQAELATARAYDVARAHAEVADSMAGQGREIQRELEWLNDFYQSAEGLQRPEGLWISGHPDFEGISTWIFDVYLRSRLRGESEEKARQSVEDAIKRTDEWGAKHRGPS